MAPKTDPDLISGFRKKGDFDPNFPQEIGKGGDNLPSPQKFECNFPNQMDLSSS